MFFFLTIFFFFFFFCFLASSFRLFLVFFVFFYFLFFLQVLQNMSFLLTVFEFYSQHYKFNFLNIVYLLSFDGLALYFILLTILLFLACLLLAWNLRYKLSEFLVSLFFINLLLFHVFSVVDLVFFYIFFEAMLMPMFLLIGIWGASERKLQAAYQFFLYTLFGSLFMLMAIFFLYSHQGTADFSLFLGFSVANLRQFLFWVFFFFAVAVKVPMFPVHMWLPEAHVEAPTAGSVILAGVLLKLGLFALLKFLFPSFAFASITYTPSTCFLALFGVFFASCSTLSQIDMKKLVAYSSVAHMNFVVLGMFSFNFYGLMGGILLMLGHGLVSSGLFLSVGVLYDSYKTSLFLYFGGLISLMPIFASLFFVLVLANMSFPGTFNFVGEMLVFFGLIFSNFFVCLLSGVTMVFSAAYSLALFSHTMCGSLNCFFVKHFSDLSKSEFYIIYLLVILTIFFGIFPNFVIIPLECNLPLYMDAVLYVAYA